MKKIVKYLAILTVIFIVGCQNEYITYTKDESGIYFKELDMSSTTTTVVSFGLISSEFSSKEVEIEVTLIGQIKDYDREFIFVPIELTEDEIVKDSDGLEKDRYKPAHANRPDGSADYKIVSEKIIIPAGENKGIVKVAFYRTDLGITSETRKIYFEIRENEHFKILYPINPSDVRTTQISFLINEKIYTPWWWDADDDYGVPMFGTYSKKKSLMIADKYNIERTLWTDCSNLEQLGGIGHLRYLGMSFQLYLNDEKAAGNTIYEVDGTTEMVMGEWTLDNLN